MKIICERDALNRAISAVIGRARPKTKIVILQHIKLSAAESRLILTATDMETRAETFCAAEVLTSGVRCLPADRLGHLIAGFSEGAQVSIEIKASEAHICCGTSRYRLPTLEAADFPEGWEPTNPVEVRLPHSDVKALFGDPQSAVGMDSGRFYLQGGCFYQPERGQIAVVATDGTRLIRRSIPGDHFPERPIVPRVAMAEIVKLAHDGEVSLTFGSNMVVVSAGALTFASKLIDGRFPDVERIIPEPRPQFILVDRTEMVAALKRLISVEESNGRVTIAWHDDGQPLQMSLHGKGGFGSEEIKCECDVPSGQIAFASSILMQALEAAKGDVVQLHPPLHSSQALRIIDPADPGLLIMSMPLRESAVTHSPEQADDEAA